MQSNLHQFLGLTDQDSESDSVSVSDFEPDFLQSQYGNHYWTGVKTGGQLAGPDKSDYDIYDDILAMQQTTEYASVAEATALEYLFDPEKFGMKDPTLVTENYKLDTE